YDPFSALYCDGAKIGHNWTCYGAENGMFRYIDTPSNPPLRLASATDGTSNTILLGENLIDKHTYLNDNSDAPPGGSGRGCWTMDSGFQLQNGHVPINYPTVSSEIDGGFCTRDPKTNVFNLSTASGYKSNHTSGVNFGFLDGSIRFVSQNIDQITLIRLSVRNDGEPVTMPCPLCVARGRLAASAMRHAISPYERFGGGKDEDTQALGPAGAVFVRPDL